MTLTKTTKIINEFDGMPDTVRLRDFLATKAIKRHKHLVTHKIEIPFSVVARFDDLDQLWQKILTNIPPDSTPDISTCSPPTRSVVQGIRNGEYSNSYCVLFLSEAFGRHPEYGSGIICNVEVDWSQNI